MTYTKSYSSYAVKLFDTWRLLFFGFILLSFILGFIFKDALIGILASAVLSVILAAGHILISYSEVILSNGSVTLKNMNHDLYVKNLRAVKTWWSYDYGLSTIDYVEQLPGKMRGHVNKINCFVKFEGEHHTAYIYEQIHFSEKFPNGHPYLPNEKIDASRIVRVWDIDDCLATLGLDKSFRAEKIESSS